MERQDLSPGELMPAIVQDAGSGRVLMLAWMDEEALRRTRESGEAWFWSRSRQEYWHKGATRAESTPSSGRARRSSTGPERSC
jgi:phosphoribosyl-AMP cyclohydrolase